MSVPGIDLSNNNGGPIDWQQIAASGVRFVWHKISEGAGFVDKYAAPRLKEAQAHGIAGGGYHFARPGTNPPDVEAALFLKNLPVGLRLRPVLDLEKTTLSGPATVGWAQRWLELVDAAGHRPILYTYSGFAQASLPGGLGAWDLWLANYRTTPPLPPQGWSKYIAWQHADNGNIPGVPGHVDMNLAERLDDLLVIPGPGPVPTPPLPSEETMQNCGVFNQKDAGSYVLGPGVCVPLDSLDAQAAALKLCGQKDVVILTKRENMDAAIATARGH